MSAITTHVLDTAQGQPASGVPVLLETRGQDGTWSCLGQGSTDTDGRLRDLLPAERTLEAGSYRITFDTDAYFRAQGVEGFYAEVAIAFEVRDPAQHYHVPLLLSPYGYSTYRGS
jgi:5-hydroxyisourate hydrolase